MDDDKEIYYSDGLSCGKEEESIQVGILSGETGLSGYIQDIIASEKDNENVW